MFVLLKINFKRIDNAFFGEALKNFKKLHHRVLFRVHPDMFFKCF